MYQVLCSNDLKKQEEEADINPKQLCMYVILNK